MSPRQWEIGARAHAPFRFAVLDREKRPRTRRKKHDTMVDSWRGCDRTPSVERPERAPEFEINRVKLAVAAARVHRAAADDGRSVDLTAGRETPLHSGKLAAAARSVSAAVSRVSAKHHRLRNRCGTDEEQEKDALHAPKA